MIHSGRDLYISGLTTGTTAANLAAQENAEGWENVAYMKTGGRSAWDITVTEDRPDIRRLRHFYVFRQPWGEGFPFFVQMFVYK